MKLREIFCFELACHSRRVSTWFYFAALLLLTRYMTMEIASEFASSERFFFHAPLIVAIVSVFSGLIGLLIAAAIAGDAGARDVQARIDPLLYTSPVSKGTHLAGRFLAALSLHALILLAVPIALLLVEVAPPRDAGLVGPFRPIVYVAAYGLIALPNAFISTAFLFSIAALSRRAMASYLGALFLGGLCVLNWAYLARALGEWRLAQLLDPFAGTALSQLAMQWTPVERSTRLIGSQGSVLLNRLVWIAIALAVLALTYFRYRLAHHVPGGFWRRLGSPSPQAEAGPRDLPIIVPSVKRSFHFVTHARQAVEIAQQSFRQIMANWGAVVIAVIGVLAVATGMDNDFMGVPLVATAASITAMLSEAWWGAIVSLLITFHAGELIWSERNARVSEITDAAPIPEWVSIVGKFAGLSLVLAALQLVMMCAGIIIQTIWKQYDFEFPLYARILFGLQLVDYVLLAVLAFSVHALVNHKYVGHFLFAIAYMLMTVRGAMGIENNLLIYGSDPGWAFSDMRGFEPFIEPWLWFKAYWGAWALLLSVATRLTWVRGRDTGFAARIALARGRLRRPAAWFAAASLALVAVLGGFIFYSTHVVNRYQTSADSLARRAEYERRYSQYARSPQPQLTGASLKVEIYPKRREVEIRGAYRLVNTSADAIEAVHLSTSSAVDTTAVSFDRLAKNVVSDELHGHQTYMLESPLRPGESLRLEFEAHFKRRGFSNRGADTAVVANSTYFTNEAWLPAIGYQRDRELQSAGERRSHGLRARPAFFLLDDEEARRDLDRSARVDVEAIIGTDQEQIAVAPGRLRRSWSDNGRRYFHYATDAPIRNDYAFYSATYAVRQARWRPSSGTGPDVSIEVFHHPAHVRNVDRIIRSVQASLGYYTKALGPYPHQQVRFIEHPGNAVVLHAAPVNVSYDERFSILNPDQDRRGLDLPFAVVAHEMAHQWWGNTLTPAGVEGASLLTETLAWYSAMAVVEQALGPDHLARLLAMMREVYLIPDTRANVPLLRAADRFLAYRKGPFAMYALREYVGRQPIDTALRRFLDRYPAGSLPLSTSRDLYRELHTVTPASLRTLLADLFERNTYWELATERVTATRTGTGVWQVTLDVRARKVVVNEDGAETELPMDDQIEVGVFARPAGGALGEELYLQRHRVRSGEQRIIVTVPRQPALAGIDPRRLLIDVDGDDNIREIGR